MIIVLLHTLDIIIIIIITSSTLTWLQEYESEGIDWTKVEFIDNQECVDVIEAVPPK